MISRLCKYATQTLMASPSSMNASFLPFAQSRHQLTLKDHIAGLHIYLVKHPQRFGPVLDYIRDSIKCRAEINVGFFNHIGMIEQLRTIHEGFSETKYPGFKLTKPPILCGEGDKKWPSQE
jgi:hypothetical protein